MINEEKTISLGLAKKISEVAKEKGIKLPESEWVWATNDLEFKDECYGLINRNDKRFPDGFISQEFLFAYDTAELGEMLPASIDKYELKIKKASNGYWIFYEKAELKHCFEEAKYIQIPDTLANVLGKMYLYLLENDLLINQGCI